MKRIIILAAALCLGACASQPTTIVPANQPATQTGGAALAATAQAHPSTGRAYLDDHDLIHVQAPPSNRRVIVLGTRQETN